MGAHPALPGLPALPGAGPPAAFAIEIAGWNGWRVLDKPVSVTLQELGLRLDYTQGSWSGSAMGSLAIGAEAGAATIELKLILPYDTTAFTLTYEPTPNLAPPTIGALVSFLAAGWTLPGPVGEFANAIEINEFTVGVGSVNKLKVALTAFQGKVWELVPGDGRFTLGGVFLQMQVSSAAPPAGSIGGTLTIGQGRIPLVAQLLGSWTQFAIALDDSREAKPPTVADMANLIDRSWGEALPPAIGKLGEGIDLNAFRFERVSAGWGLEIAVGTRPGWEYQPISSFAGLVFTKAAIGFEKAPGAGSRGGAELAARVLEMGATFTLTVPQAKMLGKLEGDALNLRALCKYVTGEDLAPWLESVGLYALELELKWNAPSTYRLSAELIREIDLPAGSSLRKASVTGIVMQGRFSFCIEAEWVPPGGGAGIPGKLCVPFKCFNPTADPNRCIEFPPKTKPQPNPDKQPTYGDVAKLVAAVIGAGVVAAAMAAAAYGASAAQATGAILQAPGGAASLAQLGRGVSQAFNFNGQASRFLPDVQKGFEMAGKALPNMEQAAQTMSGGGFSPCASALAMKANFRPTPGPAQMANALVCGWAQPLPASETAAALATCSYPPVECAQPIKAAYPQLTPGELAGVLVGAGFTPRLTPPALTACLLRAGFTPQLTAPTLAVCLLGAFPGLPLEPLLGALAGAGFAPYGAFAAAIAHYYPVVDSGPALALARAYPGIEPLAVAVALGAGKLGGIYVEVALRALFGAIQQPALAMLSQATSPFQFDEPFVEAVRRHGEGASLSTCAQALQDGWPQLSIYTLTALLGGIYAPTPSDLAFAAIGASPSRETSACLLAVLLYRPATLTAAEVATWYVQALARRDGGVSPDYLAGGLVYAFGSVGRRPDAGTAMRAMLAAYISVGATLKPAEAVHAVYQWLAVNAAEAVRALVAAYTNPPIVPGQCAYGVAYGFTQGVNIGSLAAALVDQFSLSRCPTATGAVALALRQATTDVARVLAALAPLMSGWDRRAEATVGDVMVNPMWQSAYLQRLQSNATPSQVAQQLKRTMPTVPPLRVVEVLVAVFVLVTPTPAATPIAEALKSIGTPYAAALAALQGFFAGVWTDANTAQVRAVYGV